MRMLLVVVTSFGVLLCAVSSSAPPKTTARPLTEKIHGVALTDPYRWLEDQNSPDTRAWIDQQIAYTRSVLDRVPGRDRLQQKVTRYVRAEHRSRPRIRSGRYFYTRQTPAQEQAVLCMRVGLNGAEQVLVDPNPMSADHSISVDLMDVSTDGTLLAFGIRKGGEDQIEVRLMDTSTKQELPDRLARERIFSLAITPDKKAMFFTRHLKEGPRVYRHSIGGKSNSEQLIFGEGVPPTEFLDCGVTDSGRYLVLTRAHGSAGDKTEVYARDLRSSGPIIPLVNDIDARFFPELAGDRLFLYTNWKAPKGRVLLLDLASPARDQWKEVVPEREAALEQIAAVGGKLAALYLENAIPKVTIYSPDGKLVRELQTPGLGSTSLLLGQWAEDEAFYSFSSFAQPETIYRYNVSNGKQELWFQPAAGLDPSKIDVKQEWFSSKDGTRVPMFVACRKAALRDKNQPVLLTGYGGFNVSMRPQFSALSAAWIESGGTVAMVILRGGGEFGEAWHRAGMLEKKQNVFDDFIGAAGYLIQQDYTNPSRLAIAGGSNGGLLVGAALTQRPDLFRAVVCFYPLLDMIRYDKFKIAKAWVPEYGTADNAEQFRYLLRYSPYHHVEHGAKYPAVMFTTGDGDTRVDPLHARKMTALLQASSTSGLPVLLRYDKDSGHSGGLSVSKEIEQLTDVLAFLCGQLGVKP